MTSLAPARAGRDAVDSQPLSEALIASALRWLDAQHPDRARLFDETPELRFYAVKDIIEALEAVGVTDDADQSPERGEYKRSTVAMRLRRMRDGYRIVSRQVPNMGQVRGTIGMVYALPPEGMSPEQMAQVFRASGEEAARDVEEMLRRPRVSRAPRRATRGEEKVTKVFGNISWPEARETNRLAELSGLRRPQYVAAAIRAYNQQVARELEHKRAQRGSARAYAPPLS